MQSYSFLTNPSLSLIWFGGKGGVGKTTSSAATALYLADKNPQKRILLASIDPAHSLMDSLKGTDDFKNLTVWEIDAKTSFRKFIKKYNPTIKKILERGTFLDEQDISHLLMISLPGIDELMGMLELVDLMERSVYDVIILDTAPTGHTIKFLQIPGLIKRWIHIFDLMTEKHRYMSRLYRRCYLPDDTDAFIAVFTESTKRIERVFQGKSCEFVPVMLPEGLSVRETIRFLSILGKSKIPVKSIILNRFYPLSKCLFCKGQYFLQKKHFDEMKQHFNEYNFLIAPLYKDEVHGKELLLKFAQTMVESFSRDSREEIYLPQNTVKTNKMLSCIHNGNTPKVNTL